MNRKTVHLRLYRNIIRQPNYFCDRRVQRDLCHMIRQANFCASALDSYVRLLTHFGKSLLLPCASLSPQSKQVPSPRVRNLQRLKHLSHHDVPMQVNATLIQGVPLRQCVDTA